MSDTTVTLIAPQNSANPLLQKLQMPGRIFKLPSGGLFYNNGELDASVVNGEIHVHPISAIAEINLKNPDMLFSGAAVERVFKECIPDIKKASELYGKDVDAIMCFLRMVTYGSTYEVTAKHNCTDAKNHTYAINLDEVVNTAKPLDPTTAQKQYSTTLRNGQVIELEPIRFKHVIQLLQTMDKENNKLTPEEIQDGMIKNTLNTIKSVDGVSDRMFVEEWLRKIPAPIMNQIADLIDTSNEWGLDYVRQVKCKDCQEEFSLELPVNPVSFFSE